MTASVNYSAIGRIGTILVDSPPVTALSHLLAKLAGEDCNVNELKT
jgi:hypothetical protein